jgi:hypothetical protein
VAYVYSGDTYNTFEILPTKNFKNYFVNNQKKKYMPIFFKIDDKDINYLAAGNENSGTTYSNVPVRGFVPSLTGVEFRTMDDQLTCHNYIALNAGNINDGIIRCTGCTITECTEGYGFFTFSTSGLTINDTISFLFSPQLIIGAVYDGNLDNLALGLLSYFVSNSIGCYSEVDTVNETISLFIRITDFNSSNAGAAIAVPLCEIYVENNPSRFNFQIVRSVEIIQNMLCCPDETLT